MIVLKFSATWCGPCKQVAPIAAKAADANPDRIYMDVDVDENPEAAEEWGVQGVPTVIVLDESSQIADRKVGLQAAALLR
jgi:thiol-disulfide isomerase/thioredoxin